MEAQTAGRASGHEQKLLHACTHTEVQHSKKDQHRGSIVTVSGGRMPQQDLWVSQSSVAHLYLRCVWSG